MVEGWFEDLDVRPRHAMEQRLDAFSGGNQQKVLFAKWLRRSPVVLLLDDPTQGVDIAAKAQLHAQIIQAAHRGSAVLVSTTDVDEMAALCDRVLVFGGGGIVAQLAGSEVNAAEISRASMREPEGAVHHG
jgi:ribose transport system ATP-binding protein